MMQPLSDLLSVARGDTPADLLLRGGRVVNVFTGEIEALDIAIHKGRIAAMGPGYAGRQTIDLENAFVAPGLIDAHVHIESSLCVPRHFASAVVPRGVTTAVIDPHEIANVCGVAGVRYMAEASRGLPLNVVVMTPSCVPATPMGTAGGQITDADVRQLRAEGVTRGLAEVMNFPGVISAAADPLAKILESHGQPVDGHCPGVRGKNLNAYVAAGIGSDHESITPEEAREKLSRGLYLLIREATNARNLDTLLPVITSANARRVCFCTDDRTPSDLLDVGSIDYMVRRAIFLGMEPVEAIRCATLNTSEWFGLRDVGALSPGRFADLFVFDDLRSPTARRVFSRGIEVTGVTFLQESAPAAFPQCGKSFDVSGVRFSIPARGSHIRVIGMIANQLVTECRPMLAHVVSGHAEADVDRDLIKMAVIDRHSGKAGVGLGFVQGVGLRRGALAGTVAHDHHNLVVLGADDLSMQTASRQVARMGGGLAVCEGERVLATVALPVGGLMSDRPLAEVANAYKALLDAARQLGVTPSDVFMAMSFLTLELIPSLKMTDQGLVDVDAFRFVDLFV